MLMSKQEEPLFTPIYLAAGILFNVVGVNQVMQGFYFSGGFFLGLSALNLFRFFLSKRVD
jgi:hypothetical protein